jgi:hypothetical protein
MKDRRNDPSFWGLGQLRTDFVLKMSPTAAPVLSDDQTAQSHLKGPALAIGSLSTAKDGRYQSLISQLETDRTVERQMLDRLIDGGKRIPQTRKAISDTTRNSHKSGPIHLLLGACYSCIA